MRLEILRCPFLLAALLAGHATFAHEVRPAYLEITEQSGHRFEILWKQPVMGDVAIRLIPHLSNGWLEEAPVEQQATPGSLIKHWTHQADDESLEGQTVTIEGLDRTITDVLVEVTPANGRPIRQIIKAETPSLTLSFGEPALSVPAYLALGVEHILTGVDHLLFVLGLLLLVGSRRRLVLTVTAFTVAHSITLAATTLGVIRIQPATIEALVALSILYLAVELVRQLQGKDVITARYPWAIAFTFGLLHGSAFAGALAEVGLPAHAVVTCLFLFNVGVEIGQLLFIAAAIGAVWLHKRFLTATPLWSRWVPPYAIGSFAAFWFLQRSLLVLA